MAGIPVQPTSPFSPQQLKSADELAAERTAFEAERRNQGLDTTPHFVPNERLASPLPANEAGGPAGPMGDAGGNAAPVGPAATPAAPQQVPAQSFAPGDFVSSQSTSSASHLRPEDVSKIEEARKAHEAAVHRQDEVAKQVGHEHALVINQGFETTAQLAKKAEAERQANLQARKELETKRTAQDAEYQDAVKHVPLGSALNPNAGQKIASAIAIGLSAFGSSLTHTPNAALAVIQTNIEKAMRLREQELAGKRFGIDQTDKQIMRNHELYQDAEAAHQANMANAWQMVGRKAEAMAAERQGDVTAANNQELLTGIQQKYTEHVAEADRIHSQSTSSRPSVVQQESEVLRMAAENQRLVNSGQLPPKAVVDLHKQLEKEGWTAIHDNWMRAYTASDSLKKIPGTFSRVLANTLSANTDKQGFFGKIGETLKAKLVETATTKEEREFANAAGMMIGGVMKRYEGSRPTAEDRQLYSNIVGLGPTASADQIRDVLWQINREYQKNVHVTLASYGAAGAAYENRVNPDINLPPAPREYVPPVGTKH